MSTQIITLEQAMFACLNPQMSMDEARRRAHDYANRAHRLEAERPSRVEAERDDRTFKFPRPTPDQANVIRGAFVEMYGEDEMDLGVGGTD